MDSPWTTKVLAEELMKLMPNLGRLISTYLRDAGEEETTLMQMGVLFQIQGRPTTASELAKKRRVSLQSVSVLVQSMVERGLLVRTPNPNDRRQWLLEVTPEGLERAQITASQIIGYMADLMHGLSEEEIAAAKVFLPALRQLLVDKMVMDDVDAEVARSFHAKVETITKETMKATSDTTADLSPGVELRKSTT
ncbi:MAG TPA: MarR family transcriptional regulator [Phototrophicaceae bacterium]|jgi:DNA-binding MarR family transcriptional regulator|nr:MarR family transcriptional regulator [Phototrophicaceae bacterium]